MQLALPAGETLPSIEFASDLSSEALAGSFLITPRPSTESSEPLGVGNLSVSGWRTIPPSGVALGISGSRINPNAGAVSGIPVARVFPGGAADRAGLRTGDLILELNGRDVRTQQSLVDRLRFAAPDERLVVTVSRNGSRERLPVRLIRGRLDVLLDQETAGYWVPRVSIGSAAEEAGIRRSDIIRSVTFNGDVREVTDFNSLSRSVSDLKGGDRVVIDLLRKGESLSVPVRTGDSGRNPRARIQNRLGGSSLSRRGVDFPAVLQHDTTIDADEMGGPVVD
ncbi:MAG: PDZ domain-containing protein, partial [Planctomycetota bacterium]